MQPKRTPESDPLYAQRAFETVCEHDSVPTSKRTWLANAWRTSGIAAIATELRPRLLELRQGGGDAIGMLILELRRREGARLQQALVQSPAPKPKKADPKPGDATKLTFFPYAATFAALVCMTTEMQRGLSSLSQKEVQELAQIYTASDLMYKTQGSFVKAIDCLTKQGHFFKPEGEGNNTRYCSLTTLTIALFIAPLTRSHHTLPSHAVITPTDSLSRDHTDESPHASRSHSITSIETSCDSSASLSPCPKVLLSSAREWLQARHVSARLTHTYTHMPTHAQAYRIGSWMKRTPSPVAIRTSPSP
jgi:hypothetical protein